jgi:hypothetical protein
MSTGNGRMSTSFLTWTSGRYPVTLAKSVLGSIRRSITDTYPTRCDQGDTAAAIESRHRGGFFIAAAFSFFARRRWHQRHELASTAAKPTQFA